MPDIAVLRARITVDDRPVKKAVEDTRNSFRTITETARAEGARFDQATRQAFESAAQGTETAFSRMRAGVERSFAGVGQAAGATATRVSAASRSMVTSLGHVASSLTRITTLAAGVGTALGAVGAYGSERFAQLGIDMNLAVRGAEAAATVISGSNKAAKEFVAGLREEAQTSALTFKELLPLSQSLAAAFNEVYGAEGLSRVRGTIRTFGDVAVTLGASSESMQLALQGFQQLLTNETPTKEDLLQISQNLPGSGVLGIVKGLYGSVDGDDLAKAGATGAQVAEAILAGMEKKFGGAQQRASGSLPVLLSNFSDSLDSLAASVTTRFTDQVTSGVAKALTAFQQLANSASLIDALRVPFELLGSAFNAVVDRLPQFTAWLESVLTRENVVNVLANIAGTFVAIQGGISDAWQELGKLGPKFQEFGKIGMQVADWIYRAFNVVIATIKYLAQAAPSVWKEVTKGIGEITRSIDGLTRQVKELVDAIEDLPTWMMNGGGGGAGPKVTPASYSPASSDGMTRDYPVSKPSVAPAARPLAPGGVGGGESWENFFRGISGGVKGGVSGIGDGVRAGVDYIGKGPGQWSRDFGRWVLEVRRAERERAAKARRQIEEVERKRDGKPLLPSSALGGKGGFPEWFRGLEAAIGRGWNTGIGKFQMPNLFAGDIGQNFQHRQQLGAELAKGWIEDLIGPATPRQATGRERHWLYRPGGYDRVTSVQNVPQVQIPEAAWGPDRNPQYRPIPAAPGYVTGSAYASPPGGMPPGLGMPIDSRSSTRDIRVRVDAPDELRAMVESIVYQIVEQVY